MIKALSGCELKSRNCRSLRPAIDGPRNRERVERRSFERLFPKLQNKWPRLPFLFPLARGPLAPRDLSFGSPPMSPSSSPQALMTPTTPADCRPADPEPLAQRIVALPLGFSFCVCCPAPGTRSSRRLRREMRGASRFITADISVRYLLSRDTTCPYHHDFPLLGIFRSPFFSHWRRDFCKYRCKLSSCGLYIQSTGLTTTRCIVSIKANEKHLILASLRCN
jgi:hypothetical protein